MLRNELSDVQQRKGVVDTNLNAPLFALFRLTHWRQVMLRNVGCNGTALRMSPPTLAHALLLAVLRFNVIYDVVRMAASPLTPAGT